jgi:hypothetical protein
MDPANRRKASVALGVFIIAVNFGIETVVADHFKPNPLSPLVWAVLASVGAASLAAWVWLRFGGKRAR